MPIKPENKGRYPKDWKQTVEKVRQRSGDCCEGSPAYPDCRAENAKPHPATGSTVVLTVAIAAFIMPARSSWKAASSRMHW